jgi:hypothetical protein
MRVVWLAPAMVERGEQVDRMVKAGLAFSGHWAGTWRHSARRLEPGQVRDAHSAGTVSIA